MQIRRSGKQTITTLSQADVHLLDRLVDGLAPLVRLDQLGKYAEMSADELWMTLLGQLCVRGASGHWEKASKDPRTGKLLGYRVVSKQKNVSAYLTNTLRQLAATRFHGKVAADLEKILISDQVFNGGAVILFNGLSHGSERDVIRDELRKRCNVFGLKSASDFMISVGLSHDVIALDARVLGMFRSYCGLQTSVGRVQTNEEMYLSVESELRRYCSKKGISLAALDRLIYQYAGQSVVSIFSKNELARIVHQDAKADA